VADDSITRDFGDKAIGLINSIPYSLDLNTDANHRFIASMQGKFGADIPIGQWRQFLACAREGRGAGGAS
jgi:hypothetical protein